MMQKFKQYFELTTAYKFDPTDLTAFIYTLAAIVGVLGFNPTILFFIGSVIATVFCWQAHRINLVVLNGSLFILNLYNFVKLF